MTMSPLDPIFPFEPNKDSKFDYEPLEKDELEPDEVSDEEFHELIKKQISIKDLYS